MNWFTIYNFQIRISQTSDFLTPDGEACCLVLMIPPIQTRERLKNISFNMCWILAIFHQCRNGHRYRNQYGVSGRRTYSDYNQGV